MLKPKAGDLPRLCLILL